MIEIRFFRPKFLTTRFWRFLWQRLVRGWDDSDTWSLDWTMAKFILPRLKRFKELNDGHPSDFTEEGWDEAIDKMIFAMEAAANGCWNYETKSPHWSNESTVERQEHWAAVDEGLALFGEHFLGLWW